MNYQVEIRKRLRKEKIEDERFIEMFFVQQGDQIKKELDRAGGESPEWFEESLQSIVEDAKQRYHFWNPETKTTNGEIIPERRHKGRKTAQTVDAWERQESFARYLTALMGSAGSTLVGRRLLSSEEAAAFLYSPLAASYPPGFVTHYGLDAILNVAVVDEAKDRRGPYRDVRIKGDFGTRRVKMRPVGRTVRGSVFPGDRFEGLDFAGVGHVNKLSFVVHPHNSNERIAVRANSVLAQLDKATSNLHHRLPLSPEKALWFILTGEFIPEPPVSIRWVRDHTPGWYRRVKITMEVEGWMNAEEVANHYRRAQKEVFGKIPRSPALKSWSLLEFVNENRDMTWQELFDKWNKQHPEWRFNYVSDIYQQYKRAFRKLVNGD